MMGVAQRKRRRRVPAATVAALRAAQRASTAEKPEEKRRTEDVWYAPTVKDVYAQLKVAETMLSRCNDPALAIVRRKMYDLEDAMWQFISE